MMDTMGQAAALTGGYGSTYSQSVGQQQYNAYLQQLNEIVPDIYSMAYDRYMQEGQEMQNRYAVTSDMQQGEYNRYLNDLNQYWNQVNYYTGRADTAFSQGQSEYWNGLNYSANQEAQAYERALQAAQLTGDFSGMGAFGWTGGQINAANTPIYTGGGTGKFSSSGSKPADPGIDMSQFTKHTVKKGETVADLAKRYNVDEEEIAHLNDLNSNKLSEGKYIYIPPSNRNSPYYW